MVSEGAPAGWIAFGPTRGLQVGRRLPVWSHPPEVAAWSFSVTRCSAAVLGCVWAAAPASIVNISSIAALAAGPGMGAYNATKAAVWMYTKTLALEAAKKDWNVRCNSVHPVFIKTPILDPFIAMAGGDEETAHQKLARGIPLKRIGRDVDIAACALYLASPAASWVTGHSISVDGGVGSGTVPQAFPIPPL